MTPADLAANTIYRPTQTSVSRSQVEDMVRQMKNGTFDWKQTDHPIEIVQASNGNFILDGHHRFLAIQLAGITPPNDAITFVSRSTAWPIYFEWSVVIWDV